MNNEHPAVTIGRMMLHLGKQLTVYNALVLACSNLFLDDSEEQRESLAVAVEAQTEMIEGTFRVLSQNIPSPNQAGTPEQQQLMHAAGQAIEEGRAKMAAHKNLPAAIRAFRAQDHETHRRLTESIT